jgi:hypothetical protein
MDEVWLTPFGLLLDLWECHKQYNGMARPKRTVYMEIYPGRFYGGYGMVSIDNRNDDPV